MQNDGDASDFNESRAEVFEAISHPVRIKILQALNEKPMGFAELGRAVGIEGGGHLGFHLRKLSNLVKMTPEGVYALTGDGKEALWTVNALRKSSNGQQPKSGETSIRHRSLLKPVLGAVLVAVLVFGGLAAYQQEQFAAQQRQVGSLRSDLNRLQAGLGLIPFATQPCLTQCEVASQAPLEAKAGSYMQCPSVGACQDVLGSPTFSSPSNGWREVSSNATLTGTERSGLYRTDDGGQHWRPVLSWDGNYDCCYTSITSDPDGSGASVVVSDTIFHTADGGANWAASGFPEGDLQTYYFLNPREAWVMTTPPGTSFAAATRIDIVHTSDSGGHWSRFASINKTFMEANGFNLGDWFVPRMVFANSSFGWFPSDGVSFTQPHRLGSAFLYFTRDGGYDWETQTLPLPADLGFVPDDFNTHVKFFNNQSGLIEVSYSRFSYSSIARYVYTSSDGGNSWSAPIRLPDGARGFTFIDANHWIDVPFQGAWLQTSYAGLGWEPLTANWPNNGSVTFFDSLHGWAYDGHYIWMTSNGGSSWTNTTMGPVVSG